MEIPVQPAEQGLGQFSLERVCYFQQKSVQFLVDDFFVNFNLKLLCVAGPSELSEFCWPSGKLAN